MSEKQAWSYLKSQLEGVLYMERITEKLNRGVPDVVWQHPRGRSGWLELKYLLHNGKGRVCIPWTNREQPLWLWRWARHGGRASVLCRVGTEEWYWWRASSDPSWVQWIQSPAAWSAPTLHMPSRMVVDSFVPELLAGPG